MFDKLKILLVGCGKMGSSLLQGILSSGIRADNIFVVEPHANSDEFYKLKVNHFVDHVGVPDDFDICFFAVKPQNFDEVLANYKGLAQRNCCFISIAAGKTVGKMESILGEGAAVIRAMPNLPATISAGVTAIYSNKNVSSLQRENALQLLRSVGEVVEISDENHIDVVTAISGSGPAYVFHLIEVMAKIGEELGLKSDAAMLLAKQTLLGSSKLAVESEKSPTQLRTDVTSPGGTTEAALKVLMGDNKLENLFRDAIKAAAQRAKELQ